MAYISILLRTALVLFSTLGWVHAVSKRLPVALSIPTVLCSIGSAMFFAGILNIMAETAILILVCGLYLAVRALRRHESAARLLCPGTIFLGLCAVVYFFLLYGREFVDYDSFSNWATVEKVMLQKNRFPNFLDTQIGFESYPPPAVPRSFITSLTSQVCTPSGRKCTYRPCCRPAP